MQEDQDQNFLEDQTIFAEEEPYHIRQRKKPALDEAAVVKKPPTMIYVGVALVVVLVLVGGTTMMLRNQQQQPTGPGISPTPTPIVQTASQIDQMMIELRSAIDNADPSQTSLPFPPIADQIRISQQ